MNASKGFTLIETIVYIALFAIIMTTGLLTVNQLLQSSAQTSGKATIQGEENFVLRKINWALSGASSISVLSPSALTITRYDGNTVDFRLRGTVIEMRERIIGTTYVPITTGNVHATALDFVALSPAGVTASLTIDGFTASTTKYIRK